MIPSDILSSIDSQQKIAAKNGHRLPVFVEASSDLIQSLSESFDDNNERTMHIGQSCKLKANDVIGKEFLTVVYHLHPAFNPNLLAAISGTVIRGGTLILLLDQSQAIADNFFNYVLNKIKHSSAFLKFIIKNNELIQQENPEFTSTPNQTNTLSEQTDAISILKKVVTGHRKRPVVITADRGRGKSAAIGIAIAQLHAERKTKVTITAPSMAAAAVIYKHIVIESGKPKDYEFIAPDELLQKSPATDLLVIDEAAGINPHTLEIFLQRYSRIIIATTLHGYEGSGQNFLTRFSKKLNKFAPQWKSVTLNQPIRWNINDPLEAFVNDAFLIKDNDQDIAHRNRNGLSNVNIDLSMIKTEKLNRNSLSKNIGLLCEVFSLLKNAHYKTTPADFRQLLNEDIIVFTSYHQEQLVGVSICVAEGPIVDKVVDDIYQGKRRPKGDILPQSMIMHLGIKDAAQLRFLRIMRIAVKPEFQHKGIGSHLVNSIFQNAQEDGIDLLGTAFSATTELLKFWDRLNFSTLRLGYKKNPFSGSNAVLMLAPITESSDKIVSIAEPTFIRNFISQLSMSLNNIDADIVFNILSHYNGNINKNEPVEMMLNDVKSYCQSNRSLDDNLYSIESFLTNVITRSNTFESLKSEQSHIIIMKIFQKQQWSSVCAKLNLTGKKQAEALLKESIYCLLIKYI